MPPGAIRPCSLSSFLNCPLSEARGGAGPSCSPLLHLGGGAFPSFCKVDVHPENLQTPVVTDPPSPPRSLHCPGKCLCCPWLCRFHWLTAFSLPLPGQIYSPVLSFPLSARQLFGLAPEETVKRDFYKSSPIYIRHRAAHQKPQAPGGRDPRIRSLKPA